jgi:hypothetical protein
MFSVGNHVCYGLAIGWIPLEEDLPHLFSFAKNKHITVLEAWNKNNEDLYDLFNLPLSITAHEEFHTL